MLNAVKSVLAEVSSVGPSSEQSRAQFTLRRTKFNSSIKEYASLGHSKIVRMSSEFGVNVSHDIPARWADSMYCHN